MSQRQIGRYDLRPILKYSMLPLALAVAAYISTLSHDPWEVATEAKAAMLAAPPPQIDGQRAFGYLEKLCAIGPRTAGSEANTRQRKLVADHFEKAGGTVREQPFRAVHPMTGARLQLANLIGSWHPDRLQRVVIGAHYDTRPQPDQEVDPIRFKLPFIGANDGASGVALLMEIANHLNDLQTTWGVDLVLFDGEELVFGNDPRIGEYFLGSDHFAQEYARVVSRRTSRMRYGAGIVLDMVGGRDMRIKKEPKSVRAAPQLMNEVWGVARALGVSAFRSEYGQEVMDDHLALIRAGIPAIDIIDFEYPYWHKADDLPENCSAASLTAVGRVVTGWLMLPPRTPSRR